MPRSRLCAYFARQPVSKAHVDGLAGCWVVSSQSLPAASACRLLLTRVAPTRTAACSAPCGRRGWSPPAGSGGWPGSSASGAEDVGRRSRAALVVAAFMAGVADPGRHGRLDPVKGPARIGGGGEARRLDRRPAAQSLGGEGARAHQGEAVVDARADHVAAPPNV